MSETWRPIPDLDGYEVSDLGNLRMLDRLVPRGEHMMRIPGRPLRTRMNSITPYLHTKVRRVGGGYTTIFVHSTVLTAFVGPRPEGLVARHLNDDRTDNRLVNLAWGTYSENAHDRVRNGTDRSARKEHCPRGHLLGGDNVHPSVAERGKRSCKTCINDRARERRRLERGYYESRVP